MTADRLVVAPEAWDAIVRHAREGADETPPVEVCGVLAGERGTTRDRVSEPVRVPNVAADPRSRYELDPEATLGAVDDVESGGDEVVGFYHSHPEGPPRPSSTDRERATWSGYVYLVVSLAGGDPSVDAWRWTGDRFADLTVERESPAE